MILNIYICLKFSTFSLNFIPPPCTRKILRSNRNSIRKNQFLVWNIHLCTATIIHRFVTLQNQEIFHNFISCESEIICSGRPWSSAKSTQENMVLWRTEWRLLIVSVCFLLSLVMSACVRESLCSNLVCQGVSHILQLMAMIIQSFF